MIFLLFLIWKTSENSHSAHNQRRITRKQNYRHENEDFANSNLNFPSENHDISNRRHHSRIYRGQKQQQKETIPDFPNQNNENDFNLDHPINQETKENEFFDKHRINENLQNEKNDFNDFSFNQNNNPNIDFQHKNKEFDNNMFIDDANTMKNEKNFNNQQNKEIKNDNFDAFIDDFDQIKTDEKPNNSHKHRHKRRKNINLGNFHKNEERNQNQNFDFRNENKNKNENFDDFIDNFDDIPKDEPFKHNDKQKFNNYNKENYKQTNENNFNQQETKTNYDKNYKTEHYSTPKILLSSQDAFTLSRKRYANFSYSSSKDSLHAYCRIDNQIKNGEITNPHNILCPIPSSLFMDTVFVTVSFDLNKWSAAEPVKTYPSVLILIIIPIVIILLFYIKIWFQNRPKHRPRSFSPEKFLPLAVRDLKESQFVVDTIDPENPTQGINNSTENFKIEDSNIQQLDDNNLPDVMIETQPN